MSEELINVEFRIFPWPGVSHDFSGLRDARELEAVAQMIRTQEREGGEAMMKPYIMGNVFFSENNSRYSQVSLAENRLSVSSEYRGPNPLVFYKRDEGEDYEYFYTPIASTVIPEGVRKALLLFYPMNSRPARYRILPIDIAEDKFSKGTAVIYNISPNQIALRVGDTDAQLQTGQSVSIGLDESTPDGLPIHIASSNDDGEWRTRHRRNLVLNGSDSYLMLVYSLADNPDAFRVLTLRPD